MNNIIDIINNETISDSLAIQGRNYIKNFKTKVQYFEDIGLFYNKQVKKIKVNLYKNNKVFTKTSTKTVYSISFKINNCILVDKEFNVYELNENGRLIQKGKFELCINGEKYIL